MNNERAKFVLQRHIEQCQRIHEQLHDSGLPLDANDAKLLRVAALGEFEDAQYLFVTGQSDQYFEAISDIGSLMPQK